MAWREATFRDIAAKLSQDELNQFRQSPDFRSAADPVADILRLTASFVRGFCRRNRQVTMSPVEYTMPESLISPAMDYAAFDVLKRLSLTPEDARVKAYENALQLFKEVASGEYTPESWSGEGTDEDDSRSNIAHPAIHNPPRRRKLDWHW